MAATQKTAVVVGAGPAGIASAAALAGRGWCVRVFERRPEPQAESANGRNARTYPMSLGPRSVRTLETVGLKMWQSVPQDGFVLNGKVVSTRSGNTQKDCNYIIDRQSLGYELFKAADHHSFPNGGSISWHFEHELDDINFDTKVAKFEKAGTTEPAHTTTVVSRYDLLVGADGYNSVVRQKLHGKVPSLREETPVKSASTYKTFHNLRLGDAAEKALPGVISHQPRQYLYSFRKGADVPAITMWKQEDGTLSGMTANISSYDAKTLKAGLAVALEGCPPEWVDSIVEQIHATGPQIPSSFGQITRVSQFHGPSCVLLGDAAHPVTSALGQGCNVALETVRVFVDTLDKTGLEAAPEAFTKARLNDAHAFQTMEQAQVFSILNQPAVINGVLRLPSAGEKMRSKLLLQVSALPYVLLHKLLPGIFKSPLLLFSYLRNWDMPFSKVLRLLRLQAAFALAVIVSATAAAGAAVAGSITMARNVIPAV